MPEAARLSTKTDWNALGVKYAELSDQPQRVHQLAERLLSAYRVEGGQCHLGGCLLEDVPVVRCGTPGYEQFWIRLAGSQEFSPVSTDLAGTLGLTTAQETEPPENVSAAEVSRWLETVSRQHAATLGADGASRCEPRRY